MSTLRDAIAGTLPWGRALSVEGRALSVERLADAILTLPEMAARDRVVEAARAWVHGDADCTHEGVACADLADVYGRLSDAVDELNALEGT